MLPKDPAGVGRQAQDRIRFIGIAERVETPLTDGNRRESSADRVRPEPLRTLRGPGLQAEVFIRDAVEVRASPTRPLGARRGWRGQKEAEPSKEQNACESSFHTLHGPKVDIARTDVPVTTWRHRRPFCFEQTKGQRPKLAAQIRVGAARRGP